MVLESTLEQKEMDTAVSGDDIRKSGRRGAGAVLTKISGCYCVGDASKVNKSLATSRYAKLMSSSRK